MKPLVTIIVPIYNVEKYLEKCINSIIKQTYINLEIILIDDGSPDNCAVICDNYAHNDKRIKVVHQNNGGLSVARNTGLSMAHGEYIYFLDGDDWIEKTLIEENLSIMMAEKLDMIIFGYYEEFADKTIKHLQGNELWLTQKIKDELLSINMEPCVWNKIYKKNVFHDIRFPIKQNVEDLYILGNILKNSKKIRCNEKCYYHYNRINFSSITQSQEILKTSKELFLAYERMFFWSKQVSANTDVVKNISKKCCKYAIKSFDINLLKKQLSEKDLELIINFLHNVNDKAILKLRNRILIWGILNKIYLLNFFDGYCNLLKRKYKK